MSLFSYLWDKEAKALIVRCSDDALDAGIYAIRVDIVSDSYDLTPIALAPIEMSGDISSGYMIVPLSDGSLNSETQLIINGFCNENSDQIQLSDRILLDPNPPENQTTGNAENWLVCLNEDDQPDIEVDQAFVSAPTKTISRIFRSQRDGEAIYPAQTASGTGQGHRLRLDLDSEPGEVIVKIDQTGPEVFETKATCFTISATKHVLPLLLNSAAPLHREDNKQDITLKFSGKPDDMEAAFLAPTEPLDSADEPEITELGYLDRIAIHTSPPATFVLHRDGTQTEIGKNGVAVLARVKDGKLMPDAGKLNDIVLDSYKEKSGDSPFDFFIKNIGEYGTTLRRSDMESHCDILSILYADLTQQIVLRHKSLGNKLRPHSLSHFMHAPSYFALIAMADLPSFRRDMGEETRQKIADQDEDAAIGLLAGVMLSRFADKPVETDRGLHWVKALAKSNWQALIMALNPECAKAIVGGVSPENLEPDEFGDALEEGDQTLRQEVRQLLNQLTRSGLLTTKENMQFAPVEQIEPFHRALVNLRDMAVEHIKAGNRVCGVSHHSDLDPTVLDRIGDLDLNLAQLPKHAHRPIAYFDEQLGTLGETLFFDNHEISIDAFNERIQLLFFKLIEPEYENISAILKLGFTDPIKTQSDNVIRMDKELANSYEFREESAGFRASLSQRHLSWLEGEEVNAPIIEKWRQALRAEHSERARSSGPN